MEQDKDDWLFTDIYGDVWRIIATGEKNAPFTYILDHRRDLLKELNESQNSEET